MSQSVQKSYTNWSQKRASQNLGTLVFTLGLCALTACSAVSDDPFNKKGPKGFVTLEKGSGEFSYEYPKFDFSKVSENDCTMLDMYSKADLEVRIKFAEAACVKGLVKKYSIDVTQMLYGPFGDKAGLPLEIALNDSSLFFGNNNPGGSAMMPMLLVSLGANPSALASNGKTLFELGMATEYGKNSGLIHALIETKNIDLNRKGSKGTPLEVALLADNQSIVNHLIQKGVDVNLSSKTQSSPLLTALSRGLKFSAQLLLSKEASVQVVDARGHSALHLAAQLKDVDLVNRVIKSGVNLNLKNAEGDTALHLAANSHAIEVASILISSGLNINTQNNSGQTALHVAARAGQAPLAAKLISAGADVNLLDAQLRSPLFYSVELGHDGVSQLLLDSSATTNLSDAKGSTLAHLAKSLEMLKTLLKYKAPLDRPNSSGVTALSSHVRNDAIEEVEFLVANGADLLRRDAQGNSLLHIAVGSNALKSAQFFIQKNLDINQTNNIGATPVFHVQSVAMIQLLARNGADMNRINDAAQSTLENKLSLRGDVEFVKALLDNGCDAKLGHSKKKSYLHKIVSLEPGHVDEFTHMQHLIALLGERGDRANIKDVNGSSALHLAIANTKLVTRFNASAVIQKLLDFGAVKDAKNTAGHTPRSLITTQREKLVVAQNRELVMARGDEVVIADINERYAIMNVNLEQIDELLK